MNRRGKRLLDDLDQEIRDHIELATQENIDRGISPDEARYLALRKFGNVVRVKEDARAVWRVVWAEQLVQDIRFALRQLYKSPTFTGIAVLTLVLGIGANTAVFSLVNALLLHPYDFKNLDSLVRVWENRGIDEGYDARNIAPADAADFLSGAGVFEEVTTYRDQSFNLATEGDVEPVLGCAVSASFLDVLGVRPALGRGFVTSEEQPGFDQVVLLGYSLWRQRFAGDPAILGKTIKLSERSYTVVGIMPPKFSYPVPAQLWIPLALAPEQKADRSDLSVMALARLKAGVSVAQTTAALSAYAQRLEQAYPKTNAGRSATALQLRKELYLYTVPLFLSLQAAAVFVLFLACANLANLTFARLIGRQKEIAMRAALGAGQRRLARLFICETTLFSLLAGIAAAAISFWTVRLLRSSISQDWTKWVPGWDGIQVDRTVLAIAIIMALFVGLGFGFATIVHAGRANLTAALKESGPGSLSRAKGRLRSALVVSQVAFALVLLVCAGLTIQGFLRLSNVYAALDPFNVLRIELSLPEKTYSQQTQIANFYQQYLHSAAALAGVTQVALSSNHPASNVDNETAFFTIEGRPSPKINETPSAAIQTVTPDFFPVLRIPLLAGRRFTESDTFTQPQVAIVSRSMVERYWPAEIAVGKRIKLGKSDSASPWITIIGIVADVRQNWWNPAASPTLYRPFLQSPQPSMTTLLRSGADPTSYAASVREIVLKLDSGVALRGVGTLQKEVTDSIGIIRIMGILMGVFGMVALALSLVGVYGVLSESVAQRTHEIGIRVALGANPCDLMRLVLAHALRLTLIGLVIAVPVAFVLSRLLASAIHGVVTVDLAILAEFSFLLVLVALVAAFLPARRAMGVDPMVALRCE